MNPHHELTSAGYLAAFEAALAGSTQGGVPIGSSLVNAHGVIASGHNNRVQKSDPTAHAEIEALRAAGRRPSYQDTTLYTTLAPCALCSGAIVQFKIPRVVVGEAESFRGELQWLSDRGVEVITLNDPRARRLMQDFIIEQPQLWNEDIAEPAP